MEEKISTEIGEVAIVPAKPDELEAFLQVLEEAEQWLISSKGINQWPSGCNRRCAGFYQKEIERKVVFFAKKDSEIVATLIFTPPTWLDKKLWEDLSEDALYIHRLTVRRHYAKHRVGREILKWAEKRTQQAGRSLLRIDCMAENPTLCKYFEDNGFSFQGRVDGQGWKAALFEKEVS